MFVISLSGRHFYGPFELLEEADAYLRELGYHKAPTYSVSFRSLNYETSTNALYCPFPESASIHEVEPVVRRNPTNSCR